MAVYHAIRRLALPQGQWVPVRCPIACSSVVIENTSTSAITVRTERNPDYTKRVPSGSEYTIRSLAATWDADDATECCELLAPSGDAVAVVSFTR
jgi:hypothetical protein